MKELKYVKTFEQFSIKEETIENKVEEGFFAGGVTAKDINKFLGKKYDDVEKYQKMIKRTWASQLAKKGQEDKKEIIANLDIDAATKILTDAANALTNKTNVPPLLVQNGQLIVGKVGMKMGRVGGRIGSNA